MRSRFVHNGIVWIDLESPTQKEVAAIVEEYGIHPIVAEEMMMPSTKPRAELYSGYLYAILHFPALRHSHKSVSQEIDFIIGLDFIISAHYEPIDALHKFSKVFEVNSMLGNGHTGEHAGFVFFQLLKHLYKSVEYENEHIREHLRSIENFTFSGNEVKMVSEISRCARDLLNIRQVIEPHREVLKAIETETVGFFGEAFAPYLRALTNEYYRVHNHIMRNTESLHELRETNNSLLTTKQNEAMRVLTIMALLTFPLSLLVAILTADTFFNPIRGLPYDFWIIVGSVVTGGVLMIWYFKRKKWL